MNPDIMSIQSGLAGLGFDPGPQDGLFGPRTRTAAEGWLAGGGKARAALKSVTDLASGPMIYQGGARHPVHEIVIHCAATRPDWMEPAGLAAQVAEIRRWHVRDRGWKDIGYHWLIGRDGKVLPGRPETVIGAGVTGHNTGVIHVCLIGGHGAAASDRFADHFTEAQAARLLAHLAAIAMRTGIARISGHNEWAAKACPGFNVPAWLKERLG